MAYVIGLAPVVLVLLLVGGSMLWSKIRCGTVWDSCTKDHFHSSGRGPG